LDPVTVTATIARPREEVFEYLADIANHAEFTDHFLKDFRLTREQSYGRGAGARYRVNMPLNRFPWADATIVEFEPPYRLVEQGRAGKYNRIKVNTEYRLFEGSGDTTRVELTSETEPPLITDKLLERFGARGWLKRQNRRSLSRLQSILEDGERRGRRATLAR
jgi:uncharacterized protein YndB with AHSA1/START domain